MDLLKHKTLSPALTSYDLLKTLALLLMFVDHAGYFFFPDETWFRVVGRLSVPIWFFLIGYAHTRDVPKLFWAAAILVAASSIVSGEYLFPLNIVFTLIFARMAVDWMFAGAMRNKEAFAGMFFLFFLMSGPSLLFFEYGTLGFLFTLLGALRRNKDTVIAPLWMLGSYMLASVSAYVLVQSLLLPSLDLAQLLFFIMSMAALVFVLYRFQMHSFEGLTPRKVFPVALLQLMGRRTLEIYALHLIVLRVVAMATDPERFAFMDFEIVAFPQVQSLFLGSFL